jgi:hypothetical protein
MEEIKAAGRRRSTIKAKTLKRMLKKAGLKVSGKKATLMKRAKTARLMRGGVPEGYAAPGVQAPVSGGGAGPFANVGTYPIQSGNVGSGGRRRKH